MRAGLSPLSPLIAVRFAPPGEESGAGSGCGGDGARGITARALEYVGELCAGECTSPASVSIDWTFSPFITMSLSSLPNAAGIFTDHTVVRLLRGQAPAARMSARAFAALLLLARVAVNAQPQWAQSRQDAAHTGRSPYVGAPLSTVRWNFTSGDIVTSNPAIGADGTVYVNSWDYSVYALNGVTGALKWRYATGNQVRSSPAIGADGTVYVGSDDYKVYALNGTTGALKWSYVTENAIFFLPGPRRGRHRVRGHIQRHQGVRP